MPIITDLSTPTRNPEGFVLDPDGSAPLNLGNGGSLRLAGLTRTPAAKRPEWASNADTDGAALVRIPYHDNAEWTMQVRVATTSMDDAMASIGLLEAKLQEACTLGAGGGDGLAFDWTPSGAGTTLRGYMLYAQITDMPISYDDGWFAAKPIVTVPFTSKPFLYGDEVSAGSATGTDPMVTIEVSDVTGDVPAEARLVITDGSTEARRWVEWGLEQRYYDSVSPSDLFIDSADLVTTGFAGSSTALSGAYGGSAISTTLLSQPVAVCGTGDLDHIGTFRVKARVWAASVNEYWRLTWQDGDGPFGSNDYVQPVAGGAFNELDLGLITVQEAEVGDQKWSGRIEAWTSTSGGELGELDYLMIFPRGEGYGRLEGSYTYRSGVVTGHDEFSSASGTLNARTAPAGGSWATSGATTDFSEATDILDSSNIVESRSTSVTEVSPRIALLGTGTPTDTEVGIDVHFDATNKGTKSAFAIARYVDSSNYAFAQIQRLTWNGQPASFQFGYVLAGTTTVLGMSTFTLPLASYHTIRIVAYASGRLLAWALDANGNTLASGEAIAASVLGSSGTLASGKVGFADQSNGSASIPRYYDNFYTATPAAESLIINSGQSLEIRSDSNLRQSADGASYGDIPSRGSRLFIPQAGDADLTTRIAARATREDIITSASRNDGDSLTIAVHYTPRFLVVPRG